MALKWPLAAVIIVLVLVGGCVTVIFIASEQQSEFSEGAGELLEELDEQLEEQPKEQVEGVAMAATYQQVIDACNVGDLERATELETASRPACPEGGTASFEILSTTYRNNMGTLIVERVRADNGNTEVRTLTFKNVEGIWLLKSIK